jgi:hypothetical protein
MAQNENRSKRNQAFTPQPNQVAIEHVIAHLVAAGLLTGLEVGLINAARSAAALVDTDPSPAAIKEYGNCLDRLRSIGKEQHDAFDALLEELRSAPGNT